MNSQTHNGLSFWEQNAFFNKKDLIVVGAGIVGLSAALAYKQSRPGESVLIVDRELFPKGASSRNAGFACFGSMTELLADEEAMGQETMVQLVARRWKGLKQLRKLVGDTNMDYLGCGGYEVFTATQSHSFEKARAQMSRINGLLAPIVNHHTTFSIHEDSTSIGLHPDINVIENKLEGQLNPGKMMKQLIALNQEAGVEIRRGHELEHWTETESGISLNFAGNLQLDCQQALLATNGFTRRLFPDWEVEPARNQIFITEPIPDLGLNGTFHAEEGYIYFRNVGNRLLIGGGRHWNKGESITEDYEVKEDIIKQLKEYINSVVHLEEMPLITSKAWSGILGVGKTKKPILNRHSRHMVAAVRLGGMGVAIGVGVGTQAAELLLD